MADEIQKEKDPNPAGGVGGPHGWGEFDLNNDGCVNERDKFVFEQSFGSTPRDPNWNPRCDFNQNGKVDDMDATYFSEGYNKFYRHGPSCRPIPSPNP